jgi:hypothetical protein
MEEPYARLENGPSEEASGSLLPSPTSGDRNRVDKKQFPVLQFLLLVSGLKSTSTAFPFAFSLSLSAAILFFGYIYHSLHIRELDWSMLCHLVFSIHGAAVYSLITVKLSQQLDIFSVIDQLKEPLRLSMYRKYEKNISLTTAGASTSVDCVARPMPSTGQERQIWPSGWSLEFISQATSIFVFVTALMNFIAVWLEVGNPIAIVLCLPHILPIKALSLFLWFFYSFGWFLPVALVCPPVLYLLQQIFQYERYVAAHLSENCDIDLLMHWYSELYDTNTILQNAFGSLSTLTIVIGGVFQIILTMVSLVSLFSSLSLTIHRNSLLLRWIVLGLSLGLVGRWPMPFMYSSWHLQWPHLIQ